MFVVTKKKKLRSGLKSSKPTLKKERGQQKPRSISVSKSKDNVRLPTKTDDMDEQRGKCRAFASLNE